MHKKALLYCRFLSLRMPEGALSWSVLVIVV